MDFSKIGKRVGQNDDPNAGSTFQFLLAASQVWQTLDKAMKKQLPSNLHAYVQVACMENDELIVVATHNMAASRLKMLLPTLLPHLQTLHSDIKSIKVKLKPTEPPKKRVNPFRFPAGMAQQFLQTAQSSQNPELAAKWQKLAAIAREQESS